MLIIYYSLLLKLFISQIISLYIYSLSQTNIRGDEKITFKVYGVKDSVTPFAVKFRLIQDLHGLPAGSPPLLADVTPYVKYLGDCVYQLDLSAGTVSGFLTTPPNLNKVIVLEASEKIDEPGRTFNLSNGVAMIYVGTNN